MLFRKLSYAFWEGEGNDYAEVVFDSIKGNAEYLNLVVEFNSTTREKPWFFAGLFDMIVSLWPSPAFGEILARLVAFFFEELQHERFKKHRPLAMSMGMQVSIASLPLNTACS